jgi:hypothetical protein
MEVGESASAQREEKKRVLILFLLARGSSVKGVEQPKGPPHGLQFRFILYLARFFEKL